MKINSIGRLAFLCLLGAAACMLSVSCGDGVSTDGTSHTFSGVITDSVAGVALESVQVSYSADTASAFGFYTDSTGHYQGATWGGHVTIYAHKDGYVSQSRNLTLDKNLTGINFKLVQR